MYEDKIAKAIEYSSNNETMTEMFKILTDFFAVIMLAFLLVVLYIVVTNLIYPKSKRYREKISDLYIVTKIKQIAKKEDLDIDSELQLLSKLDAKGKSFDKVLEDRLNEKLLNDLDKKK